MFKSKILGISTAPVEVTFDGIFSSQTLSIQNTHASEHAYLGNPTVTSTDYGFKLKAGESLTLDLSGQDKLWAMATANVYLAVMIIAS